MWMGLIYWLSSQPVLPTVQDTVVDLLLKKGGHFLLYAVLALAVLRSLAMSWRWDKMGRIYPVAFCVCVAYAVLDEVHQSFTPNRHPAYTDVLVDAFGVAVALLFVHMWTRRDANLAK